MNIDNKTVREYIDRVEYITNTKQDELAKAELSEERVKTAAGNGKAWVRIEKAVIEIDEFYLLTTTQRKGHPYLAQFTIPEGWVYEINGKAFTITGDTLVWGVEK